MQSHKMAYQGRQHNMRRRTRSIFQRVSVRILSALICFSLVGAVATTAWALDKNQIIQMSKLGLDERAIRGAIDSAGDELELTEDDINELRNQGVSAGVIDHLRRGGHVRGASAAPPAPARPGLGPAPAPAPGSGVSDPYDEERMEREIMERADELTRERALEQQRQQQLVTLAQRLPRGFSALRSNNNMQAARIFLEFLSHDPPAHSDEWYEAKFGFAKALVQEGILSGATAPLLDVLMEGTGRPRFEEAFDMLRRLTREIGYLPPILEELTRFPMHAMSESFQNHFNYYMGKFFFDYSRPEDAFQYLSRVQRGSADYPRALYLMGVSLLDRGNKDYEGALRNFQNAILAAEQTSGEHDEILQLGYLALARVFYELGAYDVALFYYQKIPTDSARNAHAMLESAWSYFMKNDFHRALGTFHTLHSSYYEQWNFPDLYVLEATVYLNLCKFPQSQRALAEFRERVLNKRPQLEEFLLETDPEVYWNTIVKSYESDNYEQRLPRVFVSSVLEHVGFYNAYNVVRALEVEKAALESNISVLGEFGQQVLDSVNEQLFSKVQEGGIIVRQSLERLNSKLQEREITAMQIAFDIDSEERTQLQQRLMNPNWEPPQAEIGTTLLIVADDWQPWPFEGEYWRDEVSNYRSRLRTECVEQ